jgi:hypothetical protein
MRTNTAEFDALLAELADELPLSEAITRTRVLLPRLTKINPDSRWRPVGLRLRPAGRRLTIRVVDICCAPNCFAVRYTLPRRKKEHRARLPLPLPPGADRWLRKAGDECGIRLVGDLIVEVGA